MKNIEGKNEQQLETIKDQGYKHLNAIEKQGEKNLEAFSKKELMEKVDGKEKSIRIVLLEDNLKDILTSFVLNFSNKGEDILKKLAIAEKILISYNNLFFKTDDY